MRNLHTRPMDETELEGWAVQRAKGRRRFIWSAGVLGFGSITAGLMILWYLAFTDILQWSPLMIAVFLAAVAALHMLGGYAFGWAMWSMMQRQYRSNAAGQRRCPQCGYRLDGIDELRCPECGHESTDAHDAHESRDVEESQE